jgi:hypothetical protein
VIAETERIHERAGFDRVVMSCVGGNTAGIGSLVSNAA